MKLTDPSIWDGRTPHPNVVEANQLMRELQQIISLLSQQERRRVQEIVKRVLELKK